jgi:hypothetical protein
VIGLVVRRFPQGPRVWLAGQRVHHGSVGCMLLAAGLHHRRVFAAGLVLVAHDRHDWRAWFVREGVPAGNLLDTALPSL